MAATAPTGIPSPNSPGTEKCTHPQSCSLQRFGSASLEYGEREGKQNFKGKAKRCHPGGQRGGSRWEAWAQEFVFAKQKKPKGNRSPAGAPDLFPRCGDAQISVFVAVSASVSSPGRTHTDAPGLNSFFLRLCCHPVANPAMAPGACGAQRQRPGHPWGSEGAPHGQCPMVSAMVSVMVTAEVSAEVSTP